MTEFGLTLALALLAAAAAAVLSRSAMRGELPPRALRETADTVRFAASAFSRLHLRGLFGLVLLAAFVLFVAFAFARPHHPSDVASSSIETASWLAGTFSLGALMVLATQSIGLRGALSGSLRLASARGPAQQMLTLAIRAASFSALLSVALPLFGLVLLAAFAWYRFAGLGSASSPDPGNMPTLLLGYALGAAIAALAARLFAGVYRGATSMSAAAAARHAPSITADHPANPAWLAHMVGSGLQHAAGHCVDVPAAIACTTVASMLLGSAVLHGNAGRVAASTGVVLFAPLLVAFGLFASIAGLAVVRGDVKESPVRAFDRGLLTTLVLGLAGYAACARWIFDTHWLWMWLAAVAGVGASLAATLVSRRGLLASGSTQAQSGAGAVVLAGLSQGGERAGSLLAAAALGLGAGYMAGSRSGLQHGGALGVAIASAAMLGPAAFVSAVQGVASFSSIASGILAAQSAPGTEATDRASRLSELVPVGAGSAGAASVSVTGVVLTVLLALAEVVGQAGATQGHASVALVESVLATAFAMAALGWFASRGLMGVWRAAEPAIRDIRVHVAAGVRPGGSTLAFEESYDPEHQSCHGMLVRDSARQAIVVGLIALAMVLVVEVALQLLTARAGLLYAAELVGGAVAAAAIAGLVLAFMLEGAASVWRTLQRGFLTKSKYAVDETPKTANNSQHGAAIVSDTVGGPIETLTAPSLEALIRVLVTATAVLAPLFL